MPVILAPGKAEKTACTMGWVLASSSSAIRAASRVAAAKAVDIMAEYTRKRTAAQADDDNDSGNECGEVVNNYVKDLKRQLQSFGRLWVRAAGDDHVNRCRAVVYAVCRSYLHDTRYELHATSVKRPCCPG